MKINKEHNMDNSNPELIIQTYKKLESEVSQLGAKYRELKGESDEHGLVIDQLSKLNNDRTAYRLIGGVLVQKTVGEILPTVTENRNGIEQLMKVVDEQHKKKLEERKTYKDQHGIMTQDEKQARERALKRAAELENQ